MRWTRYIVTGIASALAGIALALVNAGFALLLVMAAGTVADVSRAEELLQWQATGVYPYPLWLLLLFPRLAAWSPLAETTYQIVQTGVWATNGCLLRRWLGALRPTTMVWVPILVHVVLLDPVQALLGPLALYGMARPGIAWRDAVEARAAVRVVLGSVVALVFVAVVIIAVKAQFAAP